MTTSEIILTDHITRLLTQWDESPADNFEELPKYLAHGLLDEGSPSLICSLCERAVRNEPRQPDKDWRNE